MTIAIFPQVRYITAHEAVWHTFNFPRHFRYPAVERLPVHLEFCQVIRWPADEDPLLSLGDEPPRTKLTAFFEVIASEEERPPGGEGPPADQILYPEVCKYFVWQKSSQTWRRRRRQTGTIGRVFNAALSEGERFFLRVLLHHVRGPRSFVDLRTFNGTVFPTFRQACVERGLFQDDSEWESALTDASICSTARECRDLFACIVLQEEVGDAMGLFERFWPQMIDDVHHQAEQQTQRELDIRDEVHRFRDRALLRIESRLALEDRHLADFGLEVPHRPHPPPFIGESDHVSMSVARSCVTFDEEAQRQQAESAEASMNTDQRQLFNDILTAVLEETHADEGVFFIDAPGGCGKTFLLNAILSAARGAGKIAVAAATSGVASQLLEGGRTAHSWFKIPLQLDEESECNVRAQSDLAAVLRQARLIVWDEISMAHKFAVEAVERLMRSLQDEQKWFGGCTVVFAGDFR